MRLVQLCLVQLAACVTTPRRILCLQGKGGTGADLHARIEPLREAAGSSFQWDVIDAPVELSSEDFAWWLTPPGERSYTAARYKGVGSSMAYLERAWATGSYDGLMGFSQGAMLAAVIIAQATVDIRTNAIRPRFALLFGAALPKPYEKLLAAVRDLDCPMPPSLHFLSRSDMTNPPEQGEWVAQSIGGEVVWHDSGHRIPNDAAALEAACSFLELYGTDVVDVLPREQLPRRAGGLPGSGLL